MAISFTNFNQTNQNSQSHCPIFPPLGPKIHDDSVFLNGGRLLADRSSIEPPVPFDPTRMHDDKLMLDNAEGLSSLLGQVSDQQIEPGASLPPFLAGR